MPRFAVVGHPNKGKSSIVATLAQNDGIAIAMEPGTTQTSQAYQLQVDGRGLYELIDTPGFQRPRRVLEWLRAHSGSASDRPDTVRAFLVQHRHDALFHDECELLQPVMQGAGVLYVVDGSVPYSSENEAEMEILRWTGQPSLALINHIGADDHSAVWETALRQYFQTVRVFDAVQAPFEEHLGLLYTFAELQPAWRKSLHAAIHYLREQRARRRQQTIREVAATLASMLTHVETRVLHEATSRETAAEALAERWHNWQRRTERDLRRRVEDIYRYHRLAREESELDWRGNDDLFSERARATWGVSKRYLATAGFGAGALGGAGIDALTVGHSLGAGTLVGGILGAAGSLYYGKKLVKTRLGPLAGGGQELTYGPVKDPQFAYIVLGRALAHAWHVARRTHASRAPLQLTDPDERWLGQLSRSQKTALQRALTHPPRTSAEQQRRQALEDAVADAAAAFEAALGEPGERTS